MTGHDADVQAWVEQLQRDGYATTPVDRDPDLLVDWNAPHRPAARCDVESGTVPVDPMTPAPPVCPQVIHRATDGIGISIVGDGP